MVPMRDFYSSLEICSFFELFSGALSFALLSQKSLLNCAGSSYLTPSESTPVCLLVPLHPLPLWKAFGCEFAALSITWLANVSAYFHTFPLKLHVLDGLFFFLHKRRPEYKKFLTSVEELCVWTRRSACNIFYLLFSTLPPL